MKVGSLFTGIGGIDLGVEAAGMEIAWQSDWDDYCIKVLEKHWPNVPKYRDIREMRGEDLEPVELICGGFPCQPFSVAGKMQGKTDDRYLWPEMFRLIKELRPRWVLGENVANIVKMALDTVLSDLEGEGYTCRTFIIPASAVGAPHRRDRVWIVGHSESAGDTKRSLFDSGAEKPSRTNEFSKQSGGLTTTNQKSTESRLGGMLDGISSRMDGHLGWPAPLGAEQYDWEPPRTTKGMPNRAARLKALGNAVVPQVVEVIGRAIMEAEREWGGDD